MNRHSKGDQLDHKACQPPLTSSLNPNGRENLSTPNQSSDKFSQNPHRNHENENLSADNQEVGNLTTGQDQELVSVAPPLRGRQADKFEDAPPTFDELIELKKRLNDGAAWCQRRIGDHAKQQRGIDRYVRLLCSDYLPGVRALRTRGHDYASELATVEARLTNGAEVEGGDDLFAELLIVYEVLYDITDDKTLERHIDRMEYLRST